MTIIDTIAIARPRAEPHLRDGDDDDRDGARREAERPRADAEEEAQQQQERGEAVEPEHGRERVRGSSRPRGPFFFFF